MFLSKLYIYIPIIFASLLGWLINNSVGLREAAIVYSLILFLSLAAVWLIIKEQFKRYGGFLIQTFLFIFSWLLFFLFLTTLWWKYVFIIMGCLAIGIHIKYIYIYIHKVRLYPPYVLNKITPALNFIIIYFFILGTDLFAAWNFFRAKSFLVLIILFALFVWLNYYESKFSLNSNTKRIGKWVEISTISLILTEIYLVIKFLPFSFYFNTLIVSISYIIIINIWHNQKKLILTK